jgi:biopolymer transport protein TolR
MQRRRRRILPSAQINVTPLIDILLVLLVIFMTVSPTSRTGLNTALPQKAAEGQPQEVEHAIVLSIDRNGVVRINREEVEPQRLLERLREIFKTRNDRTVFVQADNELLFNDVAQLIDAAKGAGVNQVGLMTDQISAK